MAGHHSYLGLACLVLTQSITPTTRHLLKTMWDQWWHGENKAESWTPNAAVSSSDLFPSSYIMRLPGARALARRSPPVHRYYHHQHSTRTSTPTNNQIPGHGDDVVTTRGPSVTLDGHAVQTPTIRARPLYPSSTYHP